MGTIEWALITASQSKKNMPKYDRLGIVASLILLGLVLSTAIQLPSRSFNFIALGSPLTITLTGAWQMGILLTAIVCAGVNSIVRSHPALNSTNVLYMLSFWGLPGTVTVAAMSILHESDVLVFQLITLALTVFLLLLIISAQYRTINSSDRYYRSARLGLNFTVYLAAVILFLVVYGDKSRSLLSATTILVVSSLLALELLRGTPKGVSKAWLYAGITGVIMGQITWAMNYWTISPIAGGAFLLLIFYFVTGISQQHLWRQLARRTVFEFALITLLCIVILMRHIDWLR